MSSRLSGAGSSAASSSQASPLPFIQSDANGKFSLHPAAVKMISGIRGKIAPVVVAGPYRTGKSTLLNLLLDTNVKSAASAGFAVGGTVQACTKGMWLWSAPVVVGDTTFLFIDSEGLGSTDQHATFDTQIFSLSILLSSLFILNTVGTINENALEQLELVVQMTERIRIKEEKKSSGAKEESLSSLAQFFPSFLWILRDFTLDLQNAHGEKINANQYLEDALKPVPVGPNAKKGAAEKNRIRTAIATVFQQRQCVTMVRPVTEERDLQRVSTLGTSALRSDFRTQIEHLKTLIPQLAHPKAVEGVELNGRAFVAIAQNYVQAINSGGIPTIRTAFQSVQEIQGREAMDAALENVHQALKETIDSKGEKFIMADDALNALLADIQTAALTLIREQALGNASDLHELSQHFINKHLAPLFQSVRDRNTHRAEKSFASTIESLWDESGIEAHLPSYTTYKELNTDVSGFWTKYLSLTKNQGSKHAQVEIGRAFLDKKREMIFKMLFDKLTVAGQEIQSERKQKEQAEKSLAKVQQELQQIKQDRAVEIKKFELELNALQKDSTKLSKSLDDAERRARTAEERAQNDRTQLERQLADSTRSHSSQVSTLQAQLSTVQASLAEAQAELKAAAKEKARLEKALDKASAEAASAVGASKQSSVLAAEVRGLQSELAAKESELATLQAKFSSFQSSLKQVESERERELKSKDDITKAKDKQIKTLEKQLAEAESFETLSKQQERQIRTLQDELAQARSQAASAAAAASYSNPLGLPAPTKEPLVSRKSVIPSSFSGGASSSSSAAATPGKTNGKRKSSPAVVEEAAQEEMDQDHDMPDEDDNDDQSVADANRREVAAAKSAAGGQEWRDPAALSINQLKSWLTSMNVEFPQKAQTKGWYVDLVYDTLGAPFEAAFPRGAAKKKGKK